MRVPELEEQEPPVVAPENWVLHVHSGEWGPEPVLVQGQNFKPPIAVVEFDDLRVVVLFRPVRAIKFVR
jgi:hypothetical protein